MRLDILQPSIVDVSSDQKKPGYLLYIWGVISLPSYIGIPIGHFFRIPEPERKPGFNGMNSMVWFTLERCGFLVVWMFLLLAST